MQKIYTLIAAYLCLPILAYGGESPKWVHLLPKESGKVYGVGLGSIISSETKAIEIATQAARFEVLAQLRSHIEGDISTRSSMIVNRSSGHLATASSQQNVGVKSKISVESENLPGLVVKERYIDSDARTAYVLAYLDIVAVERAVSNGISGISNELKSFNTERNGNLLSSLQTLQRMHLQITKIDNLALLVTPVSGNIKLREDVQLLLMNITERVKEMKRQVSVGLAPGSSLSNELKSILRESMNGKGLIWNDHNPAIILDVQTSSGKQAIDIRSKTWWESDRSTDFIGIRTSLSCSLGDTTGNTYGSFEVDAKGVGGDEFTAKRALIKDIRKKFPLKLQEAIDSQLQI